MKLLHSKCLFNCLAESCDFSSLELDNNRHFLFWFVAFVGVSHLRLLHFNCLLNCVAEKIYFFRFQIV